ncbi:hypothetical protein DXG03_006449 [Asterophora parasitica]|uniref:G-protein coupled receptors family 2 profile 2 domain-containing protein n=1 Tax=Asterophora parasitica TaxID=117018 RepID=A0A9P7G174_9AGAR|nr:hypothetical protein DXG03_006449 [Asterophora parasitica]
MSDEDYFEITDKEIDMADVLTYACTIPGTVVCGLVLMAYGITALSPIARKCFDRVSFRLLVYSLLFNVLFGIVYAATPTHPIAGCDVGAFLVNTTLCFATFFTTCIAINLQLVLVHGVNGQKLEKYYLLGVIILSLALNVPTMVLHQFGWNELSATCWYSNPDDKARLRWIIGTQSFWISLAATIETICSSVVLFWMYLFHRDITALNRASESTVGKHECTKYTKRTTNSNRSAMLTDDPRYKKIILRIVSLLMNYSTVILDLNMSINSVTTQLDFRLLVLDLILYGLRTLAYGVLAAGDPVRKLLPRLDLRLIRSIHVFQSFMNAIREIRGSRQSSTAVHTHITNIAFASRKPGSLQSESTTQTSEGGKVMELHLRFQDEHGSEGTTTKIVSSGGRVDLEMSRSEEDEDEIQKLARQL